MRILFVGGGSIGHVAPCVSVWRAVQGKSPNAEAHFLCSTRPEESEFLRKEKVDCTALDERNQSWTHPLRLLRTYRKAASLMDHWKPDVVFSKGGSLSIPVAFAAKRRNIPIVLHESDAVMGRANRLIARWARVICTGFPCELSAVSNQPSENKPDSWKLIADRCFTGNPIRPGIARGMRQEGLKITGFAGDRPILLILGGSQGATAINDAIDALLAKILSIADVAHLTGKGKGNGKKLHGYWQREFAYDELPHLYAIADVALSRSGAGTLSELAANGIPTILVPLRGVAHDHQQRNAEAAAQSGGCIVLQQEDLRSSLLTTLKDLMTHAEKRTQMSNNIRHLAKEQAAEEIAGVILKMKEIKR